MKRRGYRRIFGTGVALAAALLGACLWTAATRADEIFLRDGRVITLTNPKVSGNSVMTDVMVGPSVGQIGYAINTITKIQMPKPPQLQAATDLLALGQPDQAIPLLDPILTFYGPLKNTTGNYWVAAALLKSTALVELRREAEAAPLLNDLATLATDPEVARLAKVRLAAIAAHRGQNKEALAIYDKALDESTEPATLAETWVDKADSLFAAKDYEGAVLAYLHVPVFYPEQRLLMPRALLGSARSFRGMDEYKKAMDQLDDLTTNYAGSADAAAAKVEMAEVEKLAEKGKQ